MSKEPQSNLYSRRDILRMFGVSAAGFLVFGPACSTRTQDIAHSKTASPTVVSRPDTQSLSDQLYKNLERYRNKSLSAESVKAVASDLTSLPQYPSFISSGQLIVDSFRGKQGLLGYDSYFNNLTKPVGINFADIGSNVAEFGDNGQMIVTEPKNLRKKVGGSIAFSGLRSVSSEPVVTLHNALLNLNVSPWLIRLMVAKEASHPLYFSKARELLLTDLGKQYEVPEDQDFGNILLEMALNIEDPQLKMPPLSPVFTTLLKRIDFGAGYWHITADLAKIKQEGKLTETDQDILAINLQVLQAAIDRKLLIKDVADKTGFVWAEGIGPFSEQWFNLVMEVQQRNGRK